jgi:predicted permease
MSIGVPAWLARVLAVRSQTNRAIADEIDSHVALHIDDLVAAGQPPEVARRNALMSLGGMAQTVDDCREHRRFAWILGVGRDTQLAVRRLRRDPSFTTAAVLTLALGIGATTAIVSVARVALASPLPYAEPDRRVMLFSRWTAFQKTSVADQEVWDYRATARTLAAVAAWYPVQQNLTGSGRPARLTVGAVTANTFDVLGSAPALGRTFAADEDRPGGPPVAILGDALWRRTFNADPAVIGRKIVLDDVAVQVVGVMPPGFRLPSDFTEDVADPTEAWRPAQIDETRLSRSHGYHAAALLAPGATAESATQELHEITRRLTEQGAYRPTMQFTAFAVSFDDEIRGPLRPIVWLLTGGVICLLLIACANVGNLLLVRGEARQRELALRAALGASSRRLLRELLIEGLALAAIGAAAALPLAFGALRVVRAMHPVSLEALGPLALDWRMLVATLSMAAATTVLFGLAPLMGHDGVSRLLRSSGTNATSAPSRARLRRGLVLIEIGIATILLVGAGLTIRSLDAMRRVDLGFNPDHVLTIRIALPQKRYATPEQVVAFYSRVAEDARRVAGIRAAGVVRLLPLASTIGDWGLDIDGFDETAGNAKGDWQIVTDGAFEALGTRLRRGRWFTASDGTNSEPVAVVNETLARTYWRDAADAVGGRLRIGRADRPWIRVVGIVADERHNGVTAAVKEKFYIPHSQWHVVTGGNVVRTAYLVVRTDQDPMRFAAALERLVQQIDPDLPVGTPRAMTDIVTSSLGAPRLTGFILGGFAAIALMLAAVGIYGVLAYVVSRRTREIGIRLALGSEPGRVVRLVVGQGMWLACGGILWGIVAALALTRLIRSLLYQVEPTDPSTFGTVALVLLVVAFLASAMPAVRASRLSPLFALKTE